MLPSNVKYSGRFFQILWLSSSELDDEYDQIFFIDFLICYNLQNDSKCRYVFYTWHISRIQFAEAQNNYKFFIMSMEFDKNISD